MSFLCLGQASDKPIKLDEYSSINTSFPTFIKEYKKVGADIILIKYKGRNYIKKLINLPLMVPLPQVREQLAKIIAEYFKIGYLDTGLALQSFGF